MIVIAGLALTAYGAELAGDQPLHDSATAGIQHISDGVKSVGASLASRIEKGIQSFRDRIREHQDKVAKDKAAGDKGLQEHHEKEIETFRKNIQKLLDQADRNKRDKRTEEGTRPAGDDGSDGDGANENSNSGQPQPNPQ